MASVLSLKNYTEEMVLEVLREILDKNPQFCQCEDCFLDAAAIALNRLKPTYFVRHRGELYFKMSAMEDQNRADVYIAITHALEKVRERPHHGQE